MNIRDSEIMAQRLAEVGFIECATPEEADVIVINTCSVRAKASQKVFSLLGSLRKLKSDKPHLKICVAGCVAQQEGQAIFERMPHVNLVVGTQHIYELPQLLARSNTEPLAVGLSEDYEIPRYVPRNDGQPGSSGSSPEGIVFSRFVTIMQGCNNFCTYCIVPYTRGREVSRNVADILDEVALLIASGVQEITLLGQNVNSYGRLNAVHNGSSPYPFARLLRDVAALPGLRRLRFTTSHPKDLSDDLIACFADLENLCPQFHLPVQSGSDAVLKRMNRNYTIAEYLTKVDRLIAARPDIALTTDIIVGFPGESDADFQATLDLLERVRYHGSFSFKYSDRPGTRAATFADKCDETVKSKRLQVFQRRQDEISRERNEAYIGRDMTVLVESITGAKAVGRTPTNHIVHFPCGTAAVYPGALLSVRITAAGQHSLRGLLIA